MADDDKDLVSEIKIEGITDSTNELKKFGDDGAAAFDKVADAAKKSGDTVANATGKMDDSVKELNNSLGITPATMAKLSGSASNLGSALSSGAKASALFVTGLYGIVTAGVGAVAGLGKLAGVLTSTVRGVNNTTDAINDQLQAQKKNNQQFGQTEAAAAQYQSQLRQLNQQVANGRVSYEEYNTQLIDLNNTYKESQRVQREVQDAQDETLRQNQELEKQAAKRQEYEKLSQTFGTTLTGALIRLGAAYDVVSTKVVNAFGPGLAALVDKLSSAVEKNIGTIDKFLTDAGNALSKFVDENGPAITEFLNGVVQVAAFVGTFITNVLVPAFKGFVAVMDVVAAAINSVFGTKLSGVILTIVAGILLFTTAIVPLIGFFASLATSVGLFLAALSPLGLALVAITAAIVALLAIDWTPLQTKAQAAWNAVVQFFATSIASVKEFFAGLWSYINDGWNLVVSTTITIWQTLVDWFNGLVQTISDIFTAVGQAIQNAFNTALEWVRNKFSEWSTAVMKIIQPIIDALNKVKALIAGNNAAGNSGAVSAAGGGYIRGPGTSTSDSIPAWLSDGEFVVKAKSVAKYGLGVLRALNAGKLDVGGAIQRFATGGLVSAFAGGVPRFATGGPVVSDTKGPGGKVFDLHIGNDVFRGLIAPDDVADKMTQFAISRGAASAGRKPAWVGGGK